MDELLRQTGALLSGLDAPWAVCGGYALDLFLGRRLRPHGDIDLCALEDGREAILDHMRKKGWELYEFRGMGRVRPLGPGVASERGRNLMCVLPPCELVDFFPSDVPGLLWHVFHHDGIRRLNYLEFLFDEADGEDFVCGGRADIRRPLSRAILRRDGMPFLCPELALLFKASRADEPDCRTDFEQTLPALDAEQRAWLAGSLKRIHPGHRWLEGLESA